MDRSVTPAEAFALLAEQATDRIDRRLRALPKGGEEISCRAGCAACCRQLVVVSPLEAFALAAWVDERPELAAGMDEAHRRHAAALALRPALVRALDVLEAAEGRPEPEVGNALELAYFAAELPCSFLREERCSVYPARPFACREHFALSDPGLCAVDLDRVVTPNTRLEFKTVAALAGHQAFGLEDRFIPLTRALEYAQARPADAACRVPAARFLALAAIAERKVRGALAGLLATGKELRADGGNGGA